MERGRVNSKKITNTKNCQTQKEKKKKKEATPSDKLCVREVLKE